jgi:hypothetical protein
MIERNIAAVLRNFLDAGFRYAILCWVLHKQEIVDRLLESLSDLSFSLSWITLVCDEDTLRRRWMSTHSPQGSVDHACHRLQQTRQLRRSHIIDNTALSIEDVVRTITGIIEEPSQPGEPG